jgi:hypothetical protein
MGPGVLIGQTKSLRSRVMEMLALESQITGNVAILGRDSQKEDGGVVAFRNFSHLHLHCHLAGGLKLLGGPMMIS